MDIREWDCEGYCLLRCVCLVYIYGCRNYNLKTEEEEFSEASENFCQITRHLIQENGTILYVVIVIIFFFFLLLLLKV